MRVYLCGPLYDPHEQRFMEAFAKRLGEAGFEVSMSRPHYSVDCAPNSSEVFEYDYDELKSSDAMVAVLDGEQVDDGTATQIGVFYGLMQYDSCKKGIIGLSTDIRTDRRVESEGKGLNLFINGLIKKVGAWYQEVDVVILHLKALGGDREATTKLAAVADKQRGGWF